MSFPFFAQTHEIQNISGKVVYWLGDLHPLFLHFPIALVYMTVISECLYLLSRKPLFNHASRFMIFSAALFAIPTVLLGFAFAIQMHYEGLEVLYFWWHRFLGIVTMIFAIGTAMLRGCSRPLYYLSLFILFLSVSVTGFFGGELSFGIDYFVPKQSS